MDKRPGTQGTEHDLIHQETDGYIQGLFDGSVPFEKVERYFISLLVSNVAEAGRLFKVLKKEFPHLKAEERAAKDRLIGRYYQVKSNPHKAIHWTRKALQAFKSLGRTDATYPCYLLLFGAYMISAQYEKARECAHRVLDDPNHTELDKLKIYHNLGILEYRLHRYHLALGHFRVALRLLEKHPGLQIAPIVYYNMANLEMSINRFGDAEAHYDMALNFFKEQGAELHVAQVLQSTGYLYSLLGQYFHADTRMKAAKSIYLARGDQVGAAYCDLDLFRLDIRLNRYKRALRSSDGLIARFEGLGLVYEVGLIYYYEARINLALKEFELAEHGLEQAIRIYSKENNRYWLALCRTLKALLMWHQGEGGRAALEIEKARVVFVEDDLKEAELQCILDHFRFTGGDLDEPAYRRVSRLLKSPIGHQLLTRAYIAIGRYWYSRRQFKRAVRYMFEAVRTVEECRASIASPDQRESYFGDKTEIYEQLIEWLFNWRDKKAPGLIFKVMELSRSRQLSEQLSALEAAPPVVNMEEPILLEMHKLDRRIASLNRKLNDLSHQPDVPDSEKANLIDSYNEARALRKKLHLELRDEDRLGVYYPIDLDHEEILKFLGEGQLVVSYFMSGTHLYRLELGLDQVRTYQEKLYRGFDRDLNSLTGLFYNRALDRMDQVRPIVERLSQVLLPTNLKDHSHVAFIPHKKLHGLPFSMLINKDRYLIETHTVSQCPNIPVLYFSLKKKACPLVKPKFFFSNAPEDPAAPERETLLRLFPDAQNYNRLNEVQALMDNADCDFIHFAGHCHFDKKDPEKSFLSMAGDQFQLSQFKNLRLNRHFVNLASCHSGSLAFSAGNEPYGFVVSFLAAGATNVLASLWEIDDAATGEWMSIFYENIHLGLAAAYQTASLALMGRGLSPYHWAGFCLMGRP